MISGRSHARVVSCLPGPRKKVIGASMGMAFDLRNALPSLLPGAIAWAEARSQEAAAAGRGLNEREVAIARVVGVQHPERIRVTVVDIFPLPEDNNLRVAAIQTGLLGPDTAGLTLGYAVLVRRGHESDRLLAHEFRHVYQYEKAGSIAEFLPQYLKQIVDFGYADSPFEVDARVHE